MFLIGRRYGFGGIRGTVRGAAQCGQFVSTPPSWARASIGRPQSTHLKRIVFLGRGRPTEQRRGLCCSCQGKRRSGGSCTGASCESVGEALIKKLQHLATHSFPL